MKKTVLITCEFPPQTGGTQRYYQEILDSIPELTVMTPPASSETQDNKRIIRQKFLNNYPLVWPKWLPLLKAVDRLIKKENYEYLLAGQALPVGTVAWVLKKKYGIPYKQLEAEIGKGERDAALKEEIYKATSEAYGGLVGATMVSDAFFPFRDGVDVDIKEGIRAIVHPGGSLRDFESIEACNEANPQVTMVFTGQRAFKH